VLVLHGSGEIGTGNRAQLTPLALAWARDEARAAIRRFVVVPQMPAESVEYSGPVTGDARTSEGTALVPATLALVDCARGHAARSIAAHLGRRTSRMGAVDRLEPAARAAGILLRRRADRRGAARRFRRRRCTPRRGSG
jgi:hypothetical protein